MTYLDSWEITALVVAARHRFLYPSWQHIRNLLVQVLFGLKVMEWRLGTGSLAYGYGHPRVATDLSLPQIVDRLPD
jgi:hypothetical protein